MSKLLSAAYGAIAYLLSVGIILFTIGFVDDAIVPKTIDHGGATSASMHVAIVIDIALVGLFGLQHSIMARPAFKRFWTRVVPAPIERSTYVVFASAALAFLMWQWRPIDECVWQLGPRAAMIAVGVSHLGWALVFLSTFLISHFELFGLRQAFAGALGFRDGEPRFRTPSLYRIVRHPLYLGFLLAFWAAPKMSVGRLVFSLAMTLYIVLAIELEETDLVAQFGTRYLEYRDRVGMLLPRLWHARRSP
ncbi:MAG TPA: isoprenylcysteine carboxylmethyltransferase family protein [Dokdonella sp.]|nr:isoprenylcysteine carboxylmethyltransferase family protein [Dokdonella sp.]